jgi:Protein of unknown function (DUF3592)
MAVINSGVPIKGRERLFLSGVCLLFGLAFGAVVVFSVVGIATELGGWFGGRSWQPAMAEIVDTNLRRTGKKGGTVYASATYRYSVNGLGYNGSRLGWNDSIWIAFSGWHEEIHEELSASKSADKRLMIWYDPANPSMSVVDRDLRWGVLIFLLPLGLFFSAVSFAAFWLLKNLWRSG